MYVCTQAHVHTDISTRNSFNKDKKSQTIYCSAVNHCKQFYGSFLCCYFNVVISMLLFQCCYFNVVISMLFFLCCYFNVVISILLFQCCYSYVAISMLLFLCSYFYVVISVLLFLCYVNVIISMLVLLCYFNVVIPNNLLNSPQTIFLMHITCCKTTDLINYN